MSRFPLELDAREDLASRIADAQPEQALHAHPGLDAAARPRIARFAEAHRWLRARLARASTDWFAAATDPADAVWPVLRDYPYGPSPR
jgi:hypothetical protein